MTVSHPEKPVNLDDARIISISQVDSWLTCERKWLFNYGFLKQSKTPSRSLSLGVLVHELLAEFYQCVKNGLSVADARQEAMGYLTRLYLEGSYSVDVFSTAQILVSRYIEQDTLATGTKIMAVEEPFFIPINNDYWYGGKIDLLVEALQGRKKGQVLLIDHKTTYDFYTDSALKLNPQMPKYAAAVRFNGYPVDEAYLNQIRTRFSLTQIPKKDDSDLFKRAPTELTQAKIRSALNHQMVASERIIEAYKKPLSLLEQECLPVRNNMICKNCPFQDPCIAMEEGMPAVKALGANYVEKTSGFQLEAKATENG